MGDFLKDNSCTQRDGIFNIYLTERINLLNKYTFRASLDEIWVQQTHRLN